MAAEIDAARLLIRRVAQKKDREMKATSESSIVELYGGRVVRVANECGQIHGCCGVIKEHPAEKYHRDAKLYTIGVSTSEL